MVANRNDSRGNKPALWGLIRRDLNLIQTETPPAGRLAIGIGPTDPAKGHFRVRVFHPEIAARERVLAAFERRKCWAI
jgi:hypothetical protein